MRAALPRLGGVWSAARKSFGRPGAGRSAVDVEIAEYIASRLSAALSHEVRNPLAAATANVEFLRGLLSATPDGDEARTAVADTLAALERIRLFVADLENFTRTGCGARYPARPREAIDDALRIAGSRLQGRVRLIPDLPAELPAVRVDRDRLVQTLVHLLVNAADALGARKDGTIRLSARARGQRLLVVVEDNGPGVPADRRDALFRAFATTKPPGPGLGLGLYLSRTFAEQMGGRLRYEDRPGGGARFVLELPVERGS